MRKVRFVLVGAGRAGMVHAQNLVYYIPEAELCAIVDVDIQRAEESAKKLGIKSSYSTIEEALERENFDAVCIASLTFTHREIIEKAVQMGKHIFCEKPLAQDIEEARKIKEVVEKSEVKFQIGFMRRYDPAMRKAFEMVQEGKIGKLVLIKSTGRGPGLPPSWILDRRKSGGMLAEVSSHDIDTILWLTQEKPERIYMEAKNFKVPEAREEFPDFYDHYVVTITFKEGPFGIIDGGCPVGYAYDARIEILGTEGMIQIGEPEKTDSPLLYTQDKKVLREAYSSWRYRFKEGYIEEMRSFVISILKDELPSPFLLDGFRVVEIVKLAHRSLELKRPVYFEGEW